MKKQFFSAKTLMLAALILVVSGCAITVKHKYIQPTNDDAKESNLLSTGDLGLGYDIVWADPEVWATNSVTGVNVRPRVFEFVPDPNPHHTIDLNKLDRDATRMRKPLGVNAEANSEFSWDETMKFISNSSEYQASHGGSFSAEGGAMGVAFSASASFKSVEEKTTAEQKTIANKYGFYKGLKLEMDLSAPHQLSSKFKHAVHSLGLDPAGYDAFIEMWGTHFNSVAIIGAKCAYHLEFKKSEMASGFSSEENFKAGVSGTVAGITAGASAGYDQSRMSQVQESTGAESISFVSYGGSGAGINDYPKWTEHAVENPTLIDAYLMSYEALFSKNFFPNDTLIAKKKELFISARERYYNISKDSLAARIKTRKLPVPGKLDFVKEPEFEVELRKLFWKTAPEAVEFDFQTTRLCWGSLQILLVDDEDKINGTTMREVIIFQDEKAKAAWLLPTQEFYFQNLVKADPQYIPLWGVRKFKLPVAEVSRYKVSLTGRLFIDWHGDNQLTYLERGDEENSVSLANMKVGKPVKKVVEMKCHRKAGEDFVVVVTYVVTRTK